MSSSSSNRPGKRDPLSILIYGLAIVGIPVSVYYLLSARAEPGLLDGAVEPPALWEEPRETPCPADGAQASEAVALQEHTRAEAARERAPFSPADGVRAVRHFRTAAACFGRALQTGPAGRARDAAESLKVRMAQDSPAHRVRLERALATARYEEARVEATLLRSFFGEKPSAYTDWLLELDRRLAFEFVGGRR